ncbi:hypothetical protein M409DRAFT_67015 [Zasmidium cellare ATCC 36951]|uniref:Enoyl reductase (ER) domain-containing protein n=1 Tax=Zasmidium cellare ATCC 36951 TaxID=1080233 RepID=A0A6A6CEH9_ZASCE|nr:uncharacterized protein M409DRAFT_67015 [Zasmidium cellare ATCC 36951]KAF2165614.1 hypothetical protein M409DRAFT_67015 [Zasmidium cellare ATCC 36951]
MRAGRWNPSEKRVIIEHVPIPQPGPNQFLVKLASASLCHSDIMAIDAGQTATLGHEGAGYIESIHPSAEGKGFDIGDKIGFLYIIGCCFKCEGCMIHILHCVTGKQLLQGFTTDGFFAEYAVVDYQNCIILPESIDVKKAAPIFCAGITAFHAVDSSELAACDWLAIVGAGGLGQIATQIAKAKGVNVVAIDINDATLEVCKQQEADQVYNSRTSKIYVEELKQLTNGGCKTACVFSNAQAAYAGVPPILRLGGVMMIVGLPHDNIPISTMDLALGRYKVKSESTSIPQRMKNAVDFLGEHGIQPEVQIRRLEDLNDMVNEMRAGTATKRMLVTF